MEIQNMFPIIVFLTENKLPMRINRILFFMMTLALLLPAISPAQQQLYNDESATLIREILELYEKGQFGSVRESIRKVKENSDQLPENLAADLAYYDAVSAIELNDKDALGLIKGFSSHNRWSKWTESMNFLEGRVHFSEKRYSEALVSFQKVKTEKLPDAEKNELLYKKGFCLLKQNNTDDALEAFREAAAKQGPYKNASTYYTGHLYYVKGNYSTAKAYFKEIRTNPQYKKTIQTYELQIAYRNGDYKEVALKGKELLQQTDTKKRAEILPVIADANYRNGDLAAALEYYNQLEKQSRTKLTDKEYYQMGLARYDAGFFSDAIRSFQQISSQNDSLIQSVSWLLGQSWLKTDQKVNARTSFLNAAIKGPDKTLAREALFNYARLALEIGSDPYNDATVLLEAFINANPDSPQKAEAHQLLVKHYLSTKNYEEALKTLEVNKKGNPELTAVYEQLVFLMATDLFNRQQYGEAITYFQKMNTAAAKANSAEALYWTAEAYYRLKNLNEAQKYYRQFLAHKSAQTTRLVPMGVYGLAYSHFQMKQYGQALSGFKQFLANPVNDQPKLSLDAQCRMGDCYFVNKDYNAAINAWKAVVDGRSHEADYALFQTAMAYGALGKSNEKLSQLDQLTSQYKQSAYYEQALYEGGSTHLVMNDPRAAISRFDRLIKERPRSAYAREATLKTGLIYFNNGQSAEAIKLLTKVTETYPGTPDAREALNTLKVIYMDMNAIDEYFKLTTRLGFGEVSNSQQDSLTFVTAENLFAEKRYNEAGPSLENYLKNFPQGQYVATTHYYLAQIKKAGGSADAIQHYEYLAANPNNPWVEESLRELARKRYDEGKYRDAQLFYERLYKQSDQPQQRTEALEGVMKCNFFNGDLQAAVDKAKQLLGDGNADAEQQLQAQYIAGKSLFELGDYEAAKKQLLAVKQKNKAALGAEASYLLARISFQNNQLQETENQVFELSEKYLRQEFWVAKGFILLADVYVKQNNLFQARETLKSIVDNYKGDELKQEAQRKLNMLQP